MKKQVLTIAGAMLAMAASVSASAQSSKIDPGVYIGVEGGYANSNALKPDPGYRVTSETKNASFMRGMLGYQFSPNWALELGYFSTGDFKQAGTNGSNSYDGKVNASGADFAGLYKFTEGLPGLFLKAGVSYAKVAATVSSTVGNGKGSASGAGYLFGLGYEYDFSPNWSAGAGYTRYQRVGNLNGVNMNVLTAGLKYRF